jgi:cytochrome c556
VRPGKYAATVILIGIAMQHVAAIAATAEISEAIKSRKANYKEIGGAFKTLNDEIKTGAPSIDTIQPLAKDLLKRGSMQMNFFPAGSGPESGEKTRAKAAIWSEQKDFNRIHDDFIRSAQTLDQAIDSGNLTAISAAQKSLGATCKSCHERYREPD